MKIFDDPANVGWNATSGPDMLGNGFGWGQQSHLLAWINFVTGLVPTEVFCRTQHSEVTGADLSHSATIRCGDDCVISISGTTLLPANAHSTPAVSKRAAIDIYGTEGAADVAVGLHAIPTLDAMY